MTASLRWSVALLVAAAVALPAGVSAAASLQPLDLRVDGGEETWRAETGFSLRWTNPAAEPAVAAVHYRLLDPGGTLTLQQGRIGWPATSIQHLSVPPIPGAYVAEIWLEDAGGGSGAPVDAELRFDDAAPGRVEPEPAPDWIARNAMPFSLRLDKPLGAEPISGIRGYAVSIDPEPGATPCPDPYSCAESEVDLRGGADENVLELEDLAEGTSYGHALGVSGSGIHSVEAGTTVLHVDKTDPETSLAGVAAGWSDRPVSIVATATDAESGMLASGAAGAFTAIRIDGGAPIVALGDSVTATVIGSGVHTVAYYGRDLAGNVADGGTQNGHLNNAPQTALVRVDREPPSLAFRNAQDPADPERIEARVGDSLSGVDGSRGQIAVRRAGSGEPFGGLPTETTGGVLRARWDSGAYPAGEYEFRAVAYDRAGNSASTTARGNGAALRLQAPLKTPTRLTAAIGGKAAQSVPYGSAATYRGRLVAGRRSPLAGMPVRVIERFGPGSPVPQRVRTVRTAASGDFWLRLGPGPSREVVALSPPTATLQGASSRPTQLAVRTGLRLKVSSPVARVGGRPLVFSGRVLAGTAGMPAGGKSIELQFRLPGLRWSEFRTIRTDERGRFRYSYSFADDDSRGVRFRFRAFAPAQAGWPFRPAGSAPVAVTGR